MSETTFCGLTLSTLQGRVMTPRPATEQLVAEALACIDGRGARVADVGTGCGAIAVALAVGAPHAEIWATDVNPTAVLLARMNARRNGVADRVHALRGDLLDPVPGELDLVVANLPYLPLHDRLAYRDLREEPVTAVFAPGDGLEPYRRLLRDAERRLRPGGGVVLQLHRRAIAAERDELRTLHDELTPLAAAA